MSLKVDLEVNERQLRDIISRLNKLEPKIAKKILRQESRRAAKDVLLPAAKSNTPVDSGLLRKNIKILAIKRSRVAVGVRVAMTSKKWPNDQIFYAGFVEYGIPAKNKKTGKAQRQRAGKWMMKRAADEQGGRASEQFVRSISARIDKEF